MQVRQAPAVHLPTVQVHASRLSVVSNNELCISCLKPGHFAKQYPSSNGCRKYLTTTDQQWFEGIAWCHSTHYSFPDTPTTPLSGWDLQQVLSNASTGSNIPNPFWWHTRFNPDGAAHALLDHYVICFWTHRSITGWLIRVAMIDCHWNWGNLKQLTLLQALSQRSKSHPIHTKFAITAVVMPHVIRDLPLQPVYNSSKRNHISNLPLADPDFGTPGRIDLWLGADIYM